MLGTSKLVSNYNVLQAFTTVISGNAYALYLVAVTCPRSMWNMKQRLFINK